MSKPIGYLYHPTNGYAITIYKGFNWPVLFVGGIWYIAKGMYGWAIGSIILAVVTFGISWIVFPFVANYQYKDFLLQQGYLNDEQMLSIRDDFYSDD